jgi:hypothetical protein
MSKLGYFKVEATLGGVWTDLSDGSYVPAADTFFGSTVKQWRKITATSPVLDGEYLIHATAGMVQEQMKWFIYGQNQVDLANLYNTMEAIFDQFDYRIRFVFDDFQETWHCQVGDYAVERSQVFTHNCMAVFTVTVPRFPGVVREEIV